ncbi:MAG: DUF1232 domain-containing protein [Chloroflexi bacterium]|nr:DUF1232 domain-containing protein [Chloroflexota bacterium]
MGTENATPNKPKVGNNRSVWLAVLREARLVWHLLRDPRVPWYLKLIPVGALGYVIMPVDLIPLNPLDDAALVSMAFYLFLELCPPEVVEEHRQALKSVIPGTWRDPDDKTKPQA